MNIKKMLLDDKGTHILIPLVFALILNFIIFIKKWEDTRKNSLLPSAPYIGLIWIIIFVSLGNAHYLLYKKSKVTFASLFLIGVMLFCISYPIITQLDRKKSITMNVIALILTSILLLVVYQESTEAFIYTLPLFAWISYVNYSDAVVCSGTIKIKSKSKPKRKKNDNYPKFIVL
jgi:hypothetical protein